MSARRQMPSAHGRGNASTLAVSPANNAEKTIRSLRLRAKDNPITNTNEREASPVITPKVLLQ
jgi:hypothetical protein